MLGRLAAGSCDVGGNDVGGVAVEGSPGPVIAHRCSGVGVGSCCLHVAQGNTGVESGGDERMPQ